MTQKISYIKVKNEDYLAENFEQKIRNLYESIDVKSEELYNAREIVRKLEKELKDLNDLKHTLSPLFDIYFEKQEIKDIVDNSVQINIINESDARNK